MVDREIILNRLKHLEENLEYLKSLQEYSKEEFSTNPDIYLCYERALHLAIEAVIDLGNHLIADQRLKTPESNRDIFVILGNNGIINEELARKLARMAGFRNILVHDYLDLDRNQEYEIIINNLQDIREFMKVVVDYI